MSTFSAKDYQDKAASCSSTILFGIGMLVMISAFIAIGANIAEYGTFNAITGIPIVAIGGGFLFAYKKLHDKKSACPVCGQRNSISEEIADSESIVGGRFRTYQGRKDTYYYRCASCGAMSDKLERIIDERD